MKTLSIEEKAKAYDKAVERAKVFKEHLLEINDKGYADEMDYIFPELKESEDEKVEKAIFAMVYDSDNELWSSYDVSKGDVLAWLEKQGEQNPDDKVESKFKVGDLVTDDKELELTEFEKSVKHVMEEAIECGDTHNLKADADMLLRLAQKPAWSEEDENHIIGITQTIDCAIRHNLISQKTGEMQIAWLKSLKPQPRWKPSDEQIEILNMILTNESMDDNIARILRELREQLKNLKRIKL